jgi:hypothetical protein
VIDFGELLRVAPWWLAGNKLRSLLTLLGFILGVGFLFILHHSTFFSIY